MRYKRRVGTIINQENTVMGPFCRVLLLGIMVSGAVSAQVEEPGDVNSNSQQQTEDVQDDSREGSTETYVLAPISVFGRQQNDTVERIPQSVNVFDRETFEITSADAVGDVLRLAPSAIRAGSAFDPFSDDFLLRGFGAEQSTNGLGFRQTDHPTDMANVERIEVLKGPASVLYGQMEPGGTVNVVTKQPLPYFQAEASAEYGRYDYRRTTADVTGPINDRVRARFNFAYQDSDSFVDFFDYRRIFFAPNITMDLTDSTNLTIEGSYSSNDWTAIQGGTPIEGSIKSNPNGDYNESFNPAFRDSFTERDSGDINVRLTRAFKVQHKTLIKHH